MLCGNLLSAMTYFVVTRRIGPDWNRLLRLEEQQDWPDHATFMDGLVDTGFLILGGPLADERRVILVVEAPSEEAVRATLERDPWHDRLLQIESVDGWTIRLDGRSRDP